MSSLSFILKKKIYALDENLVSEGEFGDEMFFIMTGKVAVIHKRTVTHIKDLVKDCYFGEIAFFSDLPRQTTVKGRDFTDIFTINKDDFLNTAL